MKKIIPFLFIFFAIVSCENEDDGQNQNHCTNGIMDANETGVDCGGDCNPCIINNITSYYIKGSIDGAPFDFQQIGNNSQSYTFGAGTQIPGLCSASVEDGIAESQFITIASLQNAIQGISTFYIAFNVDYGSSYYDLSVEEKLDFIFNSISLNTSYSFNASSTDCYQLEILYTDESGKEWSTLNGSQPSNSSFMVTEKTPFTGFPRLNSGVIKFNFNCTVFDEDGNPLNISNGEGLSLFGIFN